MPLDTHSLKSQARATMGNSSPRFWQVTLVYLLLVTVLPNLIYEIFDASLTTLIFQVLENPSSVMDSVLIGLFVTLVVTLVSMVVQVGYSLWALRCWRQEEDNGYGSLFEAFGSVGRILLTTLIVFLSILGWLFLLGTAISTIMYSLLSTALGGLDYLLFALYFGSFLLAAVLIVLRYALVPFVLIERPDLSPLRVVGLSSLMMRGRLWQMFRLYLSFIGFFLLSYVLSTGVSILAVQLTTGMDSLITMDLWTAMELISQPLPYWLGLAADTLVALYFTPYITIATAGFYDSLIQPPKPSEATYNQDIY